MIARSVIVLPTQRHLHNPIIKTHYKKYSFPCTNMEHLCIDIVDLHFRHYYLNDRVKMFEVQTQLNGDPCKIPGVNPWGNLPPCSEPV